MFDSLRRLLRMFRQVRRGPALPDGVTLRQVRARETLALPCSHCSMIHGCVSPRAGVLIEVYRAEGLCALQDLLAMTTTSCLHCHQTIPLPYLYASRATAREVAQELTSWADYAPGTFVRIEPRSK